MTVHRPTGLRRCLGVASALLMATQISAQTPERLTAITLPSGMIVSLFEVLVDDADAPSLYRFRFVAPEIGEDMPEVERVTADMEHLCQQVALPELDKIGANPLKIVVSLSAEETEFGVATPDIRQVFESFSIEDNACIWEAF